MIADRNVGSPRARFRAHGSNAYFHDQITVLITGGCPTPGSESGIMQRAPLRSRGNAAD